jgi:hypothetical protein
MNIENLRLLVDDIQWKIEAEKWDDAFDLLGQLEAMSTALRTIVGKRVVRQIPKKGERKT